MFKQHTTIVVGAGASKECNLPTGLELKNVIARLLDIRFERGFRMNSGDPCICDAISTFVERTGSRNINPHLRAAWRIRDAMPQAISIDNFIDAHQGDALLELCGKLAYLEVFSRPSAAVYFM